MSTELHLLLKLYRTKKITKKMENNIKNKVIIITGASSGLGEETAKHLAQKGAIVVLGARRADKLEQIARDITSKGGTAIYQVTDVTSKAQVQRLVDLAVTSYGRIDVLINNAGIMPIAPMRVGQYD
jgi:NADP-dependent 3-hydroxy acid dehydrogenase YdfG